MNNAALMNNDDKKRLQGMYIKLLRASAKNLQRLIHYQRKDGADKTGALDVLEAEQRTFQRIHAVLVSPPYSMTLDEIQAELEREDAD